MQVGVVAVAGCPFGEVGFELGLGVGVEDVGDDLTGERVAFGV